MGQAGPPAPDWAPLAADEEVWIAGSPSNNLVLGSLAVGFVLLIGMSITVGFATDLATGRSVSFTVLVVIVGLLLIAYAYIRRNGYLVTSDRVYSGIGLTDKRVESIDLDALRDVTIRQTGWQRLLNIGTVEFHADDGDSIAFTHVEQPSGVYGRVLEVVELPTDG